MRYTIDIVTADGRELHWTFTTKAPERPDFAPMSLTLIRRGDEDYPDLSALPNLRPR